MSGKVKSGTRSCFVSVLLFLLTCVAVVYAFAKDFPLVAQMKLAAGNNQNLSNSMDNPIFSAVLKGPYFIGFAQIKFLPANSAYSLELKDMQNSVKDRLMFNKPIFKLSSGDVDGDGHDELLVGIIKKTKFDLVDKKRLLIFYVDSVKLRPLFLSTKLRNDLIDFAVNKNKPGYVVTIESLGNDDYDIGYYEWQNFGMLFKGYKGKHLSLTDCKKEFQNEIVHK